MIWNGEREVERELHWGLPSRDPEIFQIPLLQSETATIDRPCLLLASEFGLVKRGKTIYAASLIGDDPFFCIAAVWRPGGRGWPDSFAALTVPAYPRSEERRVGTEWVSTCRSRWSPDHLKKKKTRKM